MAAVAVATATSPGTFAFHAAHAPPPAVVVGEQADAGDFEFRVPAAAAAISAADELFSGGRLVPLLLTPPPPSPPSPSSCPPPPCFEEPLSEPASPRAPRCAGRRWRDLLLLVSKKPKAGEGKIKETHFRPLLSRESSSSSSTSSCDSGKNARRPPPSVPVANLLHLMSRKHTGQTPNGSATAVAPSKRRQQQPCAHPLLTRVSSASSASSSDSGRTLRAPARPRRALAAESPRVTASGRVVFRGLERSSSSPAAAGNGARRPRGRGMERSYSTSVRVDPVISVFGFGHLFTPASPGKEKTKTGAAGGRRNMPKKLAAVLRDPHD